MNIVNRLLLVVLVLAALVGVTAFSLFPEFFIQELVYFTDWVSPRTLPELPLLDHLYLIGLAAVLDIGLLILLALQFYRPRRKMVRVQNVDGGMAEITVESIQQRLAFYIDGLEHVVSTKPTVRVKGDAISVQVEVETSAAVSVPSKAREIISIIDMVVKETLGLKLRGIPTVNIRTGSFKNLSRNEAAFLTAAKPASSPAPAAESYEPVRSAEPSSPALPFSPTSIPDLPEEEE